MSRKQAPHPSVTPRGWLVEDVAAFTRLTRAEWDRLWRSGKAPQPISWSDDPDTKIRRFIWDRVAIERWMDQRSGFESERTAPRDDAIMAAINAAELQPQRRRGRAQEEARRAR